MGIARLQNHHKNGAPTIIMVLLGLSLWPAAGFSQDEVSEGRRKIIVQILDEHGKITAAKIRVTARDSVYYAPDGHTADFMVGEAGADAKLANNRRFAYVEGAFEIDLVYINKRELYLSGYSRDPPLESREACKITHYDTN